MPLYSNSAIMKHLKTVIVTLLNLLFCAATIWFYTRYTILRPYAGSAFKEFLCALLLLGSLYANYFLLYPKFHPKGPYLIYWFSVVGIAVVSGIVDLAMAYPFIASCNARVIESIGSVSFFSTHLFFIIGRNLAMNFFPYLFRERQQLRHSLEREVQVVYRDVRKLDVTDKDSNIQLVSIDDIFYCHQQHNFTIVYMVQNKHYSRLGSMKHLEQLFGNEFIRITTTVLVPFRYIESCQDNMVVMKKMSWEEAPTQFQLESKNSEEVTERIRESIQNFQAVEEACSQEGKDGQEDITEADKAIQNSLVETADESVAAEPAHRTGRRKPITPPDEKILKVLSFIESHPNCISADIIAETQYSQSTVERCLHELKTLGLIERIGGKKFGGYCVSDALQNADTEE